VVKVARPINLTMQKSDEAADAMERLLKDGLVLPKKPKHERPDLEDMDITNLGDEQLTDLLVEYAAWANWASVTLTLAEIDERVWSRRVEIAEAYAMVQGWGGASGDRITIAKAERELDPEVQQRKQSLLEAYAFRKVAEVEFQAIDRDAFAVSREITRRGGGDPKKRRADGYAR
jgi:hypothetical protein